jgi:hypothetical protein
MTAIERDVSKSRFRAKDVPPNEFEVLMPEYVEGSPSSLPDKPSIH